MAVSAGVNWADGPGTCGGVRASGVRSCSHWGALGSEEHGATAGSRTEGPAGFTGVHTGSL